jgi:hypothetical protein
MILASGGGDPSFAFLHIYVGALNVLNWSPAALWEWAQASVGRWVLSTGMCEERLTMVGLTEHAACKSGHVRVVFCL